MEETRKQIQHLMDEGKTLLLSLPKKSAYDDSKKQIRESYRQSEPVAGLQRYAAAWTAGELTKSLFGGGKGPAKKFTSRRLRNERKRQKDAELQRIDQQYNVNKRYASQNMQSWMLKVHQLLSTLRCRNGIEMLSEVEEKVKESAKIRVGLKALRAAEKPFKGARGKQPLNTILVKAGEPLKGRKVIAEVLSNAEGYLKIQDPYFHHEILELIECAAADIPVTLLLGQIKGEDKFKQKLNLLRRSGRNIQVTTFKDQVPFHDRFIIASNSAVSCGTSLAGLGMRDSVINPLQEWQKIEERFDELRKGESITHKGSACKKKEL